MSTLGGEWIFLFWSPRLSDEMLSFELCCDYVERRSQKKMKAFVFVVKTLRMVRMTTLFLLGFEDVIVMTESVGCWESWLCGGSCSGNLIYFLYCSRGLVEGIKGNLSRMQVKAYRHRSKEPFLVRKSLDVQRCWKNAMSRLSFFHSNSVAGDEYIWWFISCLNTKLGTCHEFTEVNCSSCVLSERTCSQLRCSVG